MLTVQEIVNERNETGGSPNIKEVTKEGKKVLKLIRGGPLVIAIGNNYGNSLNKEKDTHGYNYNIGV